MTTDNEKTYSAGIDIGSTTIKLVVLDDGGKIIYGEYRRHKSHTQEVMAELLDEFSKKTGVRSLRVKMTGSGSINLSAALGIGFVQEVVAVATALRREAPGTDVAIELGGEDAKIIYFTGGLEERMNGVCAGGTGAFIDQMAALLQTDADGLDRAAADYKEIYPIAARCGVFAKTDIQALVNEGANTADLAASIFNAVVNQTISGLACGKPIRGRVAFLGGPLHFLPQLRAAFIRTLKLTDDTAIVPEGSHLFAALGAAMNADDAEPVDLDALLGTLSGGVSMAYEIKRLEPLFRDRESYDEFCRRHGRDVVKRARLEDYSGDCFLGIDAGSTTTKLALIGADGELLYSFYSNNQGSPIRTAIRAIGELADRMPPEARIAYSCSTGYGEALLKSAFGLDMGQVETIAHTEAASFFMRDVDCVLDIGGQDMKCIRLKDGNVDTILLNEACSSGCGSFLENFAASLGYTAEEFAHLALFAREPVDLGTRCTVFMNSNVKQAQKEGATVEDISAGLAYSVIKNALFKVIKLTSADALGKHIVVQGGTFYNHAVLRAFESIANVEAVCPDISGIMGAFGAALLAKKAYCGQSTAMRPFSEILALSYTTSTARCGRCQNNCMLTINKFSDGHRFITGNRCERGIGGDSNGGAPNLVAYKRKRIFDYEPLPASEAKRGVIGIPRVLNIYENFPFWATFFKNLGFSVLVSPESDRKLYTLGIESIPSESECYPAKLSHGHIEWLIAQGVTTIFHPCVFYEHKETGGAQDHYNCPIVVSYPENIQNNVEAIGSGKIRYIRPFIAFTDEKTAEARLVRLCRDEWDIPAREVREAAKAAWSAQHDCKADIKNEGRRAISWMEEHDRRGIVLAGRPYHIDPEINHGIPEMITSYGLAVLTEDSLPVDFEPSRPVRANDQWVYHSRLYTAAEFVCGRDDMELVQLNSFGCGLDAITTDQVAEILAKGGKLYTVLKVDEVNNLGAARIRLRSLLAAMTSRPETKSTSDLSYRRTEFTERMREDGYTIIAPQMSPIHFDLMVPVFRSHGYNLELLGNDNRSAIDVGLRYVNNDACFPSITVVGQVMDAVLSGRYDTDKLAIIMTQTGGCCRASNYVGFIRRALDLAGYSHIPVISLNANGMEKNEGFRVTAGLLVEALRAIVYGDILMRCIYRTRPYEAEKGSVEALHAKWRDICISSLTDPRSEYKYGEVCRGIVADFDALPLRDVERRPRVGIVGEILVKYMPLANNHLVDLLESEGAEVVVPDLLDFFSYCIYGGDYRHKFLGLSWKSSAIANAGVDLIDMIRRPAAEALKRSRRFAPPERIRHISELAKPYLSLGNQYGEGWFLAGEMVELLESGTRNIVCVQPFACLPNHVVGKGVIKALRADHPDANIVAVDYDPGASEVNQLNRIKLMLSEAHNGAAENAERAM